MFDGLNRYFTYHGNCMWRNLAFYLLLRWTTDCDLADTYVATLNSLLGAFGIWQTIFSIILILSSVQKSVWKYAKCFRLYQIETQFLIHFCVKANDWTSKYRLVVYKEVYWNVRAHHTFYLIGGDNGIQVPSD